MPPSTEKPGWLAAVAVMLLAAANFLWQLDSPSLYIDEALSWFPASQPLGDLLHQVRVDEITPWTYYVGLHEWIGRVGSEDEWVMRLPSALAGVALVGVVYRIGVLTAGRGAALLAAALAATSPLLLNYAQQARAYIWAALLLALAALAALEAQRARTPRASRLWLVALAGCSLGAIWTHYTAALAVLPLAVWVAGLGLALRTKLTLAAVVILGSLPLLPLWLDQRTRGHEEGVAPAARLTLDNLVQVAGTPFEDRAGRVTALLVLGAAALVLSTIIVARTARDTAGPLQRLVLPVALVLPLTVLAVTAVSDDVLIPRYAMVAAPFMVLLVAGATTLAPPLLGRVLAVAALIAAVGGSIASHRQEGFHPDVRGGFEAIADGYRPGDAIVLTGYPAIGPIGAYYRARETPEAALVIIPGQESYYRQVLRGRARLWFLGSEHPSEQDLERSLAAIDYRLATVRVLRAAADLQLVLALPTTGQGPATSP